jgi:hypothetical protein
LISEPEFNLETKARYRWDREKAIAYGRNFAGENRDRSLFPIFEDDWTNFGTPQIEHSGFKPIKKPRLTLDRGVLYHQRVLRPRLLGFCVSYTAEPHLFKKRREK